MWHSATGTASAASWNEILNVNLMSYVFCAKAAVAGLTRALAADHPAGQQEPVPIAPFHRLEQHAR